VNGEPTSIWNDVAERLVQNEKRFGVDILETMG